MLPQGWALVFQQKGLFHAGLPVVEDDGDDGDGGGGTKYIAQAGLLRAEPEPGVLTGPASLFKYAPGIQTSF